MTNEHVAARSLRTRLGIVAVVVTFASVFLSGCFALNQNQSKNLNWVNQSRAQYGRRALPINPDAQAKAQAWANRLASENRLYHSNLASGIHVRWCGLAENVGYGAKTQDVHASFMRSPAHRANILDTSWNGVGIGVARRGSRAWVVHVFIRTC
ncbi:MAG: CAP domain-containing protein [Acidimicrobiales bacterium]|nr:CAP domain-containing protein [Acidimicrobiales bacterium]